MHVTFFFTSLLGFDIEVGNGPCKLSRTWCQPSWGTKPDQDIIDLVRRNLCIDLTVYENLFGYVGAASP